MLMGLNLLAIFNEIVELSAVKSCGFGNVSETWSAVEPQTSKAPSDLING